MSLKIFKIASAFYLDFVWERVEDDLSFHSSPAGCVTLCLLPAGCVTLCRLPAGCVTLCRLPAGCVTLFLLPAGCVTLCRLPAGCGLSGSGCPLLLGASNCAVGVETWKHLRQLFLTWGPRTPRFQGIRELGWGKNYNFIFTNL